MVTLATTATRHSRTLLGGTDAHRWQDLPLAEATRAHKEIPELGSAGKIVLICCAELASLRALINLKTAKAIELTFSPALIVSADEVIE